MGKNNEVYLGDGVYSPRHGFRSEKALKFDRLVFGGSEAAVGAQTIGIVSAEVYDQVANNPTPIRTVVFVGAAVVGAALTGWLEYRRREATRKLRTIDSHKLDSRIK